MELDAHQLLVKVKYSGVNRADLSQAAGKYPAPSGHSAILGLEISGAVIKVGDLVDDFVVGDEVFGLVNGGGYADICVLEECLAVKRPSFLTQAQCASLSEVYLTVIRNLIEIGQLTTGQTVIIHAGASGVGLAAIQLAKLIGARVIATVRSSNKIGVCLAAGADEVFIQGEVPDFAAKIKASGEVVHLSLNLVGGNYIALDLEVLAPGGKVINLSMIAGNHADIDIGLLLRKNLQIIGSTLRNKSNAEKAHLTKIFQELVMPALANGKIHLSIDKVFALADVDAAFAYIRANSNSGKVLLEH